MAKTLRDTTSPSIALTAPPVDSPPPGVLEGRQEVSPKLTPLVLSRLSFTASKRLSVAVEDLTKLLEGSGSGSGLIEVPGSLGKKWLCLDCQAGFCGTDVSHACNLLWRPVQEQKLGGISPTIPKAVRRSHRYLLAFWVDKDEAYHLGEILLSEDGKTIEQKAALGEPDSWNVTESKILDAVVEGE